MGKHCHHHIGSSSRWKRIKTLLWSILVASTWFLITTWLSEQPWFVEFITSLKMPKF